jgi:hypothetical protein
MTRRELLTLVAGAAVVPFRLRPSHPVLVGDGISDDTAALQWLVDESIRTDRPFILRNGVYRIRGRIDMTGLRNYWIEGNWFIGPDVP